MEIRLKQKDIEAGIAMLLASQGVTRPIDNITFTKGRGGAGLMAEIECSESTPGFVANTPSNAETEPKTRDVESEDLDPQAGYRELEEAANAEASEEVPAKPKSEMSLFTS